MGDICCTCKNMDDDKTELVHTEASRKTTEEHPIIQDDKTLEPSV